jgi:hypothetical protein
MAYEKIVTCSKCAFKAEDFCCFGIFEYIDDNGNLFTIDRITGFCRECRTIRPVETLQVPAYISEKTREKVMSLEEKKNRYTTAKKRNVFRRFLDCESLKKYEQTIERFFRELAELETQLRDYQMFYSSVQIRKPCCLICNSTNCTPFSVSNTISSSKQFHPTSDIEILSPAHPDCGGTLSRYYTGTHYSLIPFRRTYNKNGKLIFEEIIKQ